MNGYQFETRLIFGEKERKTCFSAVFSYEKFSGKVFSEMYVIVSLSKLKNLLLNFGYEFVFSGSISVVLTVGRSRIRCCCAPNS